jgi:hypothetical protein
MNPLTAEDYPAATAALRDRITAVRTSVPAHSPESSPVQPQHMGQAAAASVPFSLGDTMNWLGGTQLPSLQELGKTRGPLLSVKAFVFVSTLLLLGLLVLAGFNELYIQQQAFGSAWLTDYLTLAAWGFGAEATRAALANLALGWGIARSAGSS